MEDLDLAVEVQRRDCEHVGVFRDFDGRSYVVRRNRPVLGIDANAQGSLHGLFLRGQMRRQQSSRSAATPTADADRAPRMRNPLRLCIQFVGMSQRESMPKVGLGIIATRYLLGSLHIYLAPCRSPNCSRSSNRFSRVQRLPRRDALAGRSSQHRWIARIQRAVVLAALTQNAARRFFVVVNDDVAGAPSAGSYESDDARRSRAVAFYPPRESAR